jgi:peptidoglycan/LPS O-acetylase OafA/YrhL
MGEISYATYLVHILCIQGYQMLHVAERFGQHVVINTLGTVGLLGVITLAAALLNRFIEVPARQYLRVWIDRHLPKGDSRTLKAMPTASAVPQQAL